jgi:GT2 family glycosyltransferase
MSGNPILSVITPTYNRADYLAETIDSVMSQNFESMEYLVIDDGSTDHTAEVVEGYLPRMKYVRHDNIGETRTVNRALQMSSGEFIMIVNSDDPILPGCIEKMVDALRQSPESLGAYPDWHVIGPDSRILNTVRLIEFDIRLMLTHGFVPIGPGACMRRLALELVGFRNPQLKYSADLDYWYRLALFGPIRHVAEILATHRVHPQSGSIAGKGTLLADETVYMFSAYSRHPLLDGKTKRLRALSMAHGHFAAMAACSTVDQAARHLAQGVLADPVALLIRCRSHTLEGVTDTFKQLGAERKGLAEKYFPAALMAPTRLEAMKPLVRGVLADPVGMLVLAKEHGLEALLTRVRGLPLFQRKTKTLPWWRVL